MLMSWSVPTKRNGVVENHVRKLTAAADIVDNGDAYELVLELPGVTQDGVSLNLENRELLVSAKRDGYGDNYKLLYNGRYASSTLERRFTIGEDVDREGVKAHLENGLLTITLPRKAEQKARKITIEVK